VYVDCLSECIVVWNWELFPHRKRWIIDGQGKIKKAPEKLMFHLHTKLNFIVFVKIRRVADGFGKKRGEMKGGRRVLWMWKFFPIISKRQKLSQKKEKRFYKVHFTKARQRLKL
jgi:hypothetical protein